MNKEREENKSKAMEDDDNGVALTEDDYEAATVLGNLLMFMKLDEKTAFELDNMKRGIFKDEEPSSDIDGRNEILESNQDHVPTDDEEGISRPHQKRQKRARLLLEENGNQESMEIEQEENVAKETLTPDDSKGKTAP